MAWDNLMTITLQESLRGVFYAPFYAALALEAYREQGVDVRFVSAPRPSEVPSTNLPSLALHGRVQSVTTWRNAGRILTRLPVSSR